MSDEPERGPKLGDGGNWFCVEAAPPLKWMLKHKPVLVREDDGTAKVLIHPDDAHLFKDEPDEHT